MEEKEVKKVIFIGDGMSGKTQIIVTLGQMIIDYLQKIYTSVKTLPTKVDYTHSLERADALFDERSYTIDPAFKTWAKNHGFEVKYGKNTWESVMAISLDTETIGFEDFQYVFPYFWNNTTLNITLSGADVGGQNIFDHLRNVLGKLAGSNDVLTVIFDCSRALSCWNSINQVKDVLEDKAAVSGNIPRIVYVGNKIDLEKHIQLPKWREGVRYSFFHTLEKVKNYGRGTYEIPSLVKKVDSKERSIPFKFDKGKIAFPDLEALIYKAIRESDIDYGNKIMSDVNTKALAREIAAQLVYNKKVKDSQAAKGFLSSDELVSILKNFGLLLFQRRPLAMQFAGAIEYFQEEETVDSFGRVRTKWNAFDLDVADINQDNFQSAISDASNSENLLSDMKFFSTNAIAGTGVLEMIDSIVQDKLLKDSKQRQKADDQHKPIKRRIRRF
jgi:GTPase SAR1 family protein